MVPAPTLEDVAREAGVSRATASRVVRGDAQVAEVKVAAVQAAVRRLGYVPHPAARALATRQSDAIGVLVPEPESRIFSDPFFASAIAGVNRALKDSQKQLLLVMAGPDGVDDRLGRFLQQRHADGLVVMSQHEDPTLVKVLSSSAVPMVFIGRPVGINGVHHVDVDNVTGGRLATQHLIDRGRRRIATITGPADMAASQDRETGWRLALEEAGLDASRRARGTFTLTSGAAAAGELLESWPDIDGIFVASDLMALGAIQVLHARGLRVPDDVAVVGYDDLPLAAEGQVPLTTVTNPVGELAMLAMEMLLALLQGEDRPSKVVLSPELRIRSSS